MKAQSARNLVLVTFLIFFFISCSWHRPVSPNAQNVIELKFRENAIRFNNVTIEEYFLDLDGGLGLRAFGESAPDNSCCTYYVIFDIKSLGNNSYKPHKINFGIKEKLAPNTFYNSVYYANFTEGYNITNFNITMNQKSPNLEGYFQGILKTAYTDETIELSEGVYHLNLTTVRDY